MIAIYEDRGGEMNPDDYEPTALYDGEWLAGGEEWEPYYPEGTPEEVLASQLDGPATVAVEVTEGSDELLDQIGKGTVQTTRSNLMGVGDEVTEVDAEGSDMEEDDEEE